MFPCVCVAYILHCGASVLSAVRRAQDGAGSSLMTYASDAWRAAVCFLAAVHAARRGPRVVALLPWAAEAVFGRRAQPPEAVLRPVRRSVLVSTLFALLSFAVFVAVRASTLLTRGIRQYSDAYMYGFAPAAAGNHG